MKKLNKMKWPLLILLLLSEINCVPKPPDVPVCENLTQRVAIDEITDHLILIPSPTCRKQTGDPECGHCTYIVSGKEIYVGEGKDHLLNGKTWNRIKLESIYVPAAESFAPLSEYIINSCKKLNCNDQVDAFKVKINQLQEILPGHLNPKDQP